MVTAAAACQIIERKKRTANGMSSRTSPFNGSLGREMPTNGTIPYSDAETGS